MVAPQAGVLKAVAKIHFDTLNPVNGISGLTGNTMFYAKIVIRMRHVVDQFYFI
jgi:hypothetical protein